MQKKNFIYVVLCICVAFLISGCGLLKNGPDGVTPTPVPTNKTEAVTPEPTLVAGTPTVVPLLENKEITIYVLDAETLEKKAVPVLVTVENELTADLVMEQVVEALEDGGFYIGINKIITEGDAVIIDFRSDSALICDLGSSVEGTILDIIGLSILDNIPECKKIMYQVEGGDYMSGHFEFKLGEVYMSR